MEFQEIESHSSSESRSTCDIASLQELSGLTPNKELQKQQTKKIKKYVKSMLSELKTRIDYSETDPSDLSNYINSIFYDETPADLSLKLNHRCCTEDTHDSRCTKKWKVIHEQLITLANKPPRLQKPIFLIRKRQNQSFRLLLSDSQPSWVHRLFLQPYLVLGNN